MRLERLKKDTCDLNLLTEKKDSLFYIYKISK